MKTISKRFTAYVFSALFLLGSAGCMKETKPVLLSPEPTIEAALPTPGPASEPTPEPTPEPTSAPERVSMRVVHEYQDVFEQRPGTVWVETGLLRELESTEDENEVFAAELWAWIDVNEILPEETVKRIRSRRVYIDAKKRSLAGTESFNEFCTEFGEWFWNVYYKHRQKKYDVLMLGLHSPRFKGFFDYGWVDQFSLEYYTLLDRRFPDYYELFFAYLTENGEYEKAERLRPGAAAHRQVFYYENLWYEAEYRSLVVKEFEELIELGYDIDLGSLWERFSYGGVVARLTKEQILNFMGYPENRYCIGRPGWYPATD